MGIRTALVLYVLALVAVVVGVDVLFLRNRFGPRLMVNVGIVLVFWAFYLRFLRRPRATIIRQVWLRSPTKGPVALWDGQPRATSTEHDSIYDQP